MVISIVPLIIAIVGLLMWALGSNQKVCEAGKLMFFSGVLVFTMHAGGKTFSF
jgi:hypothetical protein